MTGLLLFGYAQIFNSTGAKVDMSVFCACTCRIESIWHVCIVSIDVRKRLHCSNTHISSGGGRRNQSGPVKKSWYLGFFQFRKNKASFKRPSVKSVIIQTAGLPKVWLQRHRRHRCYDGRRREWCSSPETSRGTILSIHKGNLYPLEESF